MLGRATRPGIDKHGYVVLLCPSSKREFYKKFIFEPLPIESQLEQHLQDHVNAEVVLKTIESKQDAVDWLTWSFLYRRLSKASGEVICTPRQQPYNVVVGREQLHTKVCVGCCWGG